MANRKITGYVLLILNAAIIIAAEFTGGGILFFEKGIIHGIALIFIGAVAVALSRQYYLADPILKKFLNACLIAFAVFSASHAVEFLSYYFLGKYGDYLFALTLNFYIISLLIMIAGSEIFMRAYSGYKSTRFIFILSDIAIVVFAVFSTLLYLNPALISFEPANAAPYFYSFVVLTATFLFWRRILRLTRAVPQLSGFLNLLGWMAGLIAVSAFFYSSYEIIKDFLGVPEYQIIYLSHFVFYAGMSLMFVAFQKLSVVGGGVIDDIKNRKKV